MLKLYLETCTTLAPSLNQHPTAFLKSAFRRPKYMEIVHVKVYRGRERQQRRHYRKAAPSRDVVGLDQVLVSAAADSQLKCVFRTFLPLLFRVGHKESFVSPSRSSLSA